jgi:hypothetical protein
MRRKQNTALLFCKHPIANRTVSTESGRSRQLATNPNGKFLLSLEGSYLTHFSVQTNKQIDLGTFAAALGAGETAR